jgi:hypothetical protein
MAQLNLGSTKRYGFKPSFNQTYGVPASPIGWWVTPYHFGVDQGPVILMIENHRTGLIWNTMRRSPHVLTGLRRAGFQGGWLRLPPGASGIAALQRTRFHVLSGS